MIPNFRRPEQALNNAFLKVKPTHSEIEVFRSNLTSLIDHCNETEFKASLKNLFIDFLKKTYNDPDHFIKT